MMNMDERQRPQFEKILDWLENKLTEEEAQLLAEQLAQADEESLEDLRWLQSFLQLSEEIILTSPPPEVRASLSRRFKVHIEQDQPKNFLQRIRASLTFDSCAQMAAAGLRSAGADALERQLVYTTGIAQIALYILPAAKTEHYNILGQVFPLIDIQVDAFSIQLLREMIEAGLTVSDDLGEFSFKDVHEGNYDIILSTDRHEVVIPLSLNR